MLMLKFGVDHTVSGLPPVEAHRLQHPLGLSFMNEVMGEAKT